MKELIGKVKKLGLKLGIQKLIGYEAIFSWAVRERKEGNELYCEGGENIVFQVFPHSDQYWYADPLLFEYKGHEVVFMECVDRSTGIGSIGVLELPYVDEVPKIIIKEKFHMSFPMIFEWQDDLYMIPETEMNDSIVIYRCKDFPHQWDKVGEFLKGHKIVDSVVISKNDDEVRILGSEYYKENDFYTRFCMYHLNLNEEKMEAQWDGVLSEEYTLQSRMAGQIIDSRIYPIQRSTPGIYGYSVKFMEHLVNGENRCIKEICPSDINLKGKNKKLIGVHTYSLSSHYEVIDVQYLVFNKTKWLRRLKAKAWRKNNEA